MAYDLPALDDNALRTTCGIYSDCGYWSDRASTVTSSSTQELQRCRESFTSSGSHLYSPRMPRSASASTFSQFSASPLRARPSRPSKSKSIMDDSDKGIYNSLGSTSSPRGKLTYSDLGLWKGFVKRGDMWKTGPNPTWMSRWRKRTFILKGNFLYYCSPCRHMREAPVLGAIYLKNAIIKKDSMTLAKKVLKISPPVPRRMGSRTADDDSSVFYLKFKSDADRNEWYEVLQNVSFENSFPAQKEALINSSMQYTSSFKR